MKPKDANTSKKLGQLTRDNIEFRGGASILVSENYVSLWPSRKFNQDGYVSITKGDLEKIIQWYNKSQTK